MSTQSESRATINSFHQKKAKMSKPGVLVISALAVFLSPQVIGGNINHAAEIHPIVELSAECLIGGVQNKKWVVAARFEKGLKGRHKFNLYTLKGPAGEITINKLVNQSDCGDTWSADSSSPANEGIAIASPSWDVTPRLPRAIDLKDPTYVNILSDILKKEGIPKPDVRISQAYKIDLDGDGKDEVVIVANRYAQGLHELSGIGNATSAGDYTLVLVRKIIGETVRNIFLVKAVWLKAEEGPLPRGNHLSAIVDLNGDGVMELVLYSAYHEGSDSDVIEIRGAKATGVLECACEH